VGDLWLYIAPDPNPPMHECKIPDWDIVRYANAHTGSRWKCGDCGQIWQLIDENGTWTREPME
jgi:hypothetical protein